VKLTPDQKAGILITAIVHLAVIVVLLLFGIGYSVQRENTFVLDFTKQEEKERLLAEKKKKQEEKERLLAEKKKKQEEEQRLLSEKKKKQEEEANYEIEFSKINKDENSIDLLSKINKNITDSFSFV
jgi:uncharacterized membrane protein YhiD involved in acid resistance